MDYVIGVAKNSRLIKKIGRDWPTPRRRRPGPHAASPSSSALGLTSGLRRHRVVAKAEPLPGKANPRFVVTSLPADTFSAHTV